MSKETMTGTNKERTLFIHIGTGKTGTTAIQTFCVQNRKKLEAMGVWYPELGIRGVGHHSFGHLWGTGWFDDDELKQFKERHSWQELRGIFDSRNDDMLISTESLTSAFVQKDESLEEVSRAFEGVNVRIIVYLRRQDLHLESWFNQRIKAGQLDMELDLDRLSTPLFYQYGEFIDRVASVFGEGNMVVRPYEKQQFVNENIFDDFLACLNLKRADDMLLPPKGVNEKVNHQLLEFMRLCNRVERKWEKKYQFNQEVMLADRTYQITSGGGSLFDTDFRRQYLAQFEESNAYVARKYLSRDAGVLFMQPVEESEAQPLHISLEQAAELAVRLWEINDLDRSQYVRLPESVVRLARHGRAVLRKVMGK